MPGFDASGSRSATTRRQAIVADTELGVPIPASAVLTTLVRTPGDEPARWVRTHEAGRGREPLGGGLQVLKVRIETSSGDGAADTASALGSIGAVRDRSSGLPTRAETRILALAADQIALSLRRDQLRREATDVEIARQGDALKTALIDSGLARPAHAPREHPGDRGRVD